MLCIALRTGECDDGVKQAIPTKLIALSKAGERNSRYFVRRSIEGHSPAPNSGPPQKLRGLRSSAKYDRRLGIRIRNRGPPEALPRPPRPWVPRLQRGAPGSLPCFLRCNGWSYQANYAERGASSSHSPATRRFRHQQCRPSNRMSV